MEIMKCKHTIYAFCWILIDTNIVYEIFIGEPEVGNHTKYYWTAWQLKVGRHAVPKRR